MGLALEPTWGTRADEPDRIPSSNQIRFGGRIQGVKVSYRLCYILQRSQGVKDDDRAAQVLKRAVPVSSLDGLARDPGPVNGGKDMVNHETDALENPAGEYARVTVYDKATPTNKLYSSSEMSGEA